MEEPDDGGGEEEEDGQAERGGLPRIRALRVLGIQQHDDEEEQHHDGAGVDEDLQHAEEVGVEEEEVRGHPDQGQDHPHGGGHRVAAEDQEKSRPEGQGSEENKQAVRHVAEGRVGVGIGKEKTPLNALFCHFMGVISPQPPPIP